MAIRSWKEYQDCEKPADVYRQLVELGYKISERTFYRHCEKGKCRVNEDGLYSRRMVKQYLVAEGKLSQADEGGPNTELSVEKQKLENRKLELANNIATLNYKKKQGLLLDRDALHLEMASRTVALDNGYKQKIDMEAAALITVVNGDISRQVEFVDMLLQIWNELLNSYSQTDEFEVLFEEDEG